MPIALPVCSGCMSASPGAHFIVRECAGQINMLLSSLVLGRQHITSVLNEPYMDPSPTVQKAWRQVQLNMPYIAASQAQHRAHTAEQDGVVLKVAAGVAATAIAGGSAAAASCGQGSVAAGGQSGRKIV